ncbi:hypothetical protein DL93DRAFT_2061712 [Clavulina sp. PMI_390]|nr:hypothetical protein DL93DRAFT_2061712 [Clavulina sp. PMI_390]
MSLHVYPDTKEPYFQLPAPFEHFRLTQPRLSDAPFVTTVLNSPKVYPFLAGPPYPFYEEHSIEFNAKLAIPMREAAWNEIREQVLAGKTDFVAGGAPFSTIREVLPDGSEVYRGGAALIRSLFHEVVDDEERRKAQEENNAKAAGDPTIVWAFGFLLDPTQHSRGIMSAVVKSLIYDWAVPHLKAKHLVSTAFFDNIGSQKVFLKNGFHFVGSVVPLVDLTHKGRTDNTLFVYKLDL